MERVEPAEPSARAPDSPGHCDRTRGGPPSCGCGEGISRLLVIPARYVGENLRENLGDHHCPYENWQFGVSTPNFPTRPCGKLMIEDGEANKQGWSQQGTKLSVTCGALIWPPLGLSGCNAIAAKVVIDQALSKVAKSCGFGVVERTQKATHGHAICVE